ncbi:spore germination protein [Aquibacillus rhizosphaerae]|uniref:Spore germination protein n=1 Tax=Aquibacillus rhizosphaerae TaxID=3051431 RepID=A0ABT7L3H5_9BACI|nr:spore germination protein [Aquibacillus sp. LR5S19]MDL4840420.1 spore germination protein [Aquibacillus sp. LR5S19]
MNKRPRPFQKNNNEGSFPLSIEKLKQKIRDHLHDEADLTFKQLDVQNKKIVVFYISHLVDKTSLNESLLTPLIYGQEESTASNLINNLPLGNAKQQDKVEDVCNELISGSVGIYIENEKQVTTFILLKMHQRPIEKPERESIVIGPQTSFTESIDINLNVVRSNIHSTELVAEKFTIGERLPTEVRLVYLKSLANDEDVQTMRQRLNDLKVDDIEDSSVLAQYIEDSSLSVFPQFYLTERVDRFSYGVSKGKVGVLTDGSPEGIVAPSTFFSFFESTEDVYFRWNVATFFRMLRFIAMFISFIMTPVYVAVVTFHYEVLPTNLLVTLGESRSKVPFPPIMEVLFLELIIELLREAGARLPTKVGQTIGIVGGIVLGQAAVEAGLTSNVLIIVIAMSALASFTTPSYLMGSAIRVIRYPLIILAGMFGIIGVTFGLSLLIIHLLRISSLGRPYFLPVYPFVYKDLDNALFRLPFGVGNKRALSYRLKDDMRYKEKKSTKKKDIDDLEG